MITTGAAVWFQTSTLNCPLPTARIGRWQQRRIVQRLVRIHEEQVRNRLRIEIASQFQVPQLEVENGKRGIVARHVEPVKERARPDSDNGIGVALGRHGLRFGVQTHDDFRLVALVVSHRGELCQCQGVEFLPVVPQIRIDL